MKFNFWIFLVLVLVACSKKQNEIRSPEFMKGEPVGELTLKELEEASGQIVKELHKPEIDQIFVTCKRI